MGLPTLNTQSPSHYLLVEACGMKLNGSDTENHCVTLQWLICWSLEEDDVLLGEVFCVHLVGWRHAVAVAEAMYICLDRSLGTGTWRVQTSVELERVWWDCGRLRLRMGLNRWHGGFLNAGRMGGADA